uniref:Phage protein n=1 Tax=Salmonella phage vB_STmST313_KE27 TaxID=3161178 RepID=A0AAU8GK57_9CAUD
MFDQATRLKLRFNSNKGLLSVEHVWDLNLNALNELAKDLSRQVKEAASDEEDFIGVKSAVDSQLQLRFDIVKAIIGVKLKERDESATAAERKANNQAIMELIQRKKQQELEGLSVEELEKLLK